MTAMTPREIVHELDQHIIGQNAAKRAVALALRNRWRRMQLSADLRAEVTPKNILMIGPTGVGKTEIARRLARLAKAPFIKVEATKFTEVGYVGRDVETIIRDLVEMALKMVREDAIHDVGARADEAAEDRILDVLLRPARAGNDWQQETGTPADSATRQLFRRKLRSGELDAQEIDIELSTASASVDFASAPGMEDMSAQLQKMFAGMGAGKSKTQRICIKEALKRVREEEAGKLVSDDDLKARALQLVEQQGIVFIDEIDKVCRRGESSGADVSRDGVQRDLLPLIEGCTVSTKHGMIKTDYILFICSGAFHLAKPSDLIPELQGRLPIRVALEALSAHDFERILTEPNFSLTEQYKALLATEGLHIEFAPETIKRLAEVAWQVNERTENIGARRLHTVLERLLEGIGFDAADLALKQGDTTLLITPEDVETHLGALVQNEDLSRFIL